MCGFHLRNFSGIDSTKIITKNIKQSLLFSKKLIFFLSSVEFLGLLYRILFTECTVFLVYLLIHQLTRHGWVELCMLSPRLSELSGSVSTRRCQKPHKYAKWCGCPMARVPSVHRFWIQDQQEQTLLCCFSQTSSERWCMRRNYDCTRLNYAWAVICVSVWRIWMMVFIVVYFY